MSNLSLFFHHPHSLLIFYSILFSLDITVVGNTELNMCKRECFALERTYDWY
ncbi:hypothetical protein CPB83DRAFT_900881 [Crepidotus variabilis]|uniref:Uncharacterized protein n=1 Tax=Crepidotus variabilis TaxID=179855 RepID=A0A9P6BD64_9AGAR|nr:hypothetical protein CPB83DRAFT_900881 [Crepidotus variabilis]